MTHKESTLATPMVTPRECTRAKKSPDASEQHKMTPEQQCWLESILPEHTFGAEIETAQRRGRHKEAKIYKGLYARYGGVFKRLHPGKIHSQGKLVEQGHEVWKPDAKVLEGPTRKGRLQDFGEETKAY